MAMNENDGIAQVIATGGETSVNWDFKIADRQELKIVRTRSGVDETLVLNATYTIADDQLNNDLGGAAVLAGAATPAVAGDVYTLLLNTPYARGASYGTSDFSQAGDLFASVLNKQLDFLTRMCIRLGRGVSKSLRLPETDTETIEGSLPGSSARAGKALFFDADGNPSVTSDVDTVSAAAAAASASAAAASAASAAASAAGFKLKTPCRLATTANITLSGIQTIDGVLGISGDRVLVKNQTTPAENGIYIMSGGSWVRAADADEWSEVVAQLVAVTEGSTNADILFLCTVDDGGTIGTTAITYTAWYAVVPDNTVTNAKLADMSGNTVKVRASATSGDPSDLALTTSQIVGRGSTGDIAALSIGSGLIMSGTTLNAIQQVYSEYVTYGTVTANIPYDSTIPQNTEGTEILSLSITPKSASSFLDIQVVVNATANSGGRGCAALFVDSTANAIAAGHNSGNTAQMVPIIINKRVASGSTSARTYKVRVGDTSGTLYINGNSTGSIYGGVSTTMIKITEYLP